jgi:hypothetical protein
LANVKKLSAKQLLVKQLNAPYLFTFPMVQLNKKKLKIYLINFFEHIDENFSHDFCCTTITVQAMPNLNTLDTPILLDLLAVHTAEYTDMLNNNQRGEKFASCEAMIASLQQEINSRKISSETVSISDPSIQITQTNQE